MMNDSKEPYESLIEALDELPEYSFDDAEKITFAHWVDIYGEQIANTHYICSSCKESALYRPCRDELGKVRYVQELSAYCHSCGACMLKKRVIVHEIDEQNDRSFVCSIPLEDVKEK